MIEAASFFPKEEFRSSPLRRLGSPFLDSLAGRIHESIPALTPDHLSALSALSGITGAILARRYNTHKSAGDSPSSRSALLFLAAGVALDCLDGPLARRIALQTPEAIDLVRGSLLDTTGDYLKDVTVGVVKILNAPNSRSRTAASLALGTNYMARYSIQKGLADGKNVPEIGRNIVEFFSTPTAKSLSNIVESLYPDVGILKLQQILDIMATLGNVASVVTNAVDTPVCESLVTPKMREIGYARSRFHIGAIAANIAIVAGVNFALRTKNNK